MYDSAGNPTTYAGSACTFDVFNRATSLGTALTAGYRSDGLRAWKQDSAGNRTYYLYDGVSPLCEMDASGSWKGEFLYGPAGLISHSRSGLGTVFFAYDALGSVQSVWRDTGTLVSSRVYDAYGEQTGGIVADSMHDDATIGYNGQSGYITDPETSLVLCGHRYYDPSAGRWLNRDPIGYSGGIGLYNYCANNPVMGVDTSGFSNRGEELGGGGDCGEIAYDNYGDGGGGLGSDGSGGMGGGGGGLGDSGGDGDAGNGQNVPSVVYHYSSDPNPASFQNGLKVDAAATNRPDLTAYDAEKGLGLSRYPNTVYPVNTAGSVVRVETMYNAGRFSNIEGYNYASFIFPNGTPPGSVGEGFSPVLGPSEGPDIPLPEGFTTVRTASELSVNLARGH